MNPLVSSSTHTHVAADIVDFDSAVLSVATPPFQFYAYDSVGGLSLNAGFTPIPWSAVVRQDTAVFSHTAGASSITIVNYTGDLRVTADVTTTITSGNAQSDSSFRIALNAGAGFVAVPGSAGWILNRSSAQGTGTASATVLIAVAPGYIVRVEAERESGTSTIRTLAGASRITLQTVAPAAI